MIRFPCARCGQPVSRSVRDDPRRIRCPRCRYLIYDYPRVCAGMMVVKRGALLVLRRGSHPKRGYLDFPGGFVDANESIDTAARRELREETGLTVGVIEPLGYFWDRYFLKGFGYFPTLNYYWLARWRSGTPLAADDAAHAEWMPLARVGRSGGKPAWRHMTRVLREVRRRVG
jgi:ADP-ribose pyrophosphatase YjhB (NUDIX family)